MFVWYHQTIKIDTLRMTKWKPLFKTRYQKRAFLKPLPRVNTRRQGEKRRKHVKRIEPPPSTTLWMLTHGNQSNYKRKKGHLFEAIQKNRRGGLNRDGQYPLKRRCRRGQSAPSWVSWSNGQRPIWCPGDHFSRGESANRTSSLPTTGAGSSLSRFLGRRRSSWKTRWETAKLSKEAVEK